MEISPTAPKYLKQIHPIYMTVNPVVEIELQPLTNHNDRTHTSHFGIKISIYSITFKWQKDICQYFGSSPFQIGFFCGAPSARPRGRYVREISRGILKVDVEESSENPSEVYDLTLASYDLQIFVGRIYIQWLLLFLLW